MEVPIDVTDVRELGHWYSSSTGRLGDSIST
jgi:hypothetical protein